MALVRGDKKYSANYAQSPREAAKIEKSAARWPRTGSFNLMRQFSIHAHTGSDVAS